MSLTREHLSLDIIEAFELLFEGELKTRAVLNR